MPKSPFLFAKLSRAVSGMVSRLSGNAQVDSPEGQKLLAARQLRQDLLHAGRLPEAEQSALLKKSVDLVASSEPKTLPQAREDIAMLRSVVAAVAGQPLPGASSEPSAAADNDAADTEWDDIIGPLTLAPKNLDEARQRMSAAREAAEFMKQQAQTPHTPSGPGATTSSAAEAELAFLREQFAHAEIVMPTSSAAGMHRGYLRRQIAFKAKSEAVSADAGAGGRALASAAGGAVTIRKADIVVPPTNADYLATYRKFAADPTAKAKRTAFYHEYGGQIQAALNDEKRESKHAARNAEMEARLKHT